MKELNEIDGTIILSLAEKRDRITAEIVKVNEALNSYVMSISENYGVAGQPRIFNNELGLLCIEEEPLPIQVGEVVESKCQKSTSESEG